VGQVRDAAAAALGDAWNHARFIATATRIEQQLAGGRLREAFDGAQALLERVRAAGEQAYPNADYDLAMAFNLLGEVLRAAGSAEQALPLLDEACQRFEATAKAQGSKVVEKMVSNCLTIQGDCLLDLGRFDDAAAAYEEGIRRSEQVDDAREVAVGKCRLGTVRMQQRRYPEAQAAYAEARERFTQLDELGSVAVSWHQTGMVYQRAGQPEAAEDAYRKSLAIKVRLGNVAGQASTLNQLGNLYKDVLGRLEEAAAFYQQAVDKSVESGDIAKEGLRRGNLADTLRRLGRFDEARLQILRKVGSDVQFGHASEPWKTWSILANIETDAGNPVAAAEAKAKAIACYLAYRRDGGENHDAEGRIALAVTQSLLANDPAQAASLLQQLAADPDVPSHARTFIRALQAIVAGRRDRALAAAPDLDYGMATEILFLIETLEKSR
jgi:tetratricopeptide (TPR) repeat protein